MFLICDPNGLILPFYILLTLGMFACVGDIIMLLDLKVLILDAPSSYCFLLGNLLPSKLLEFDEGGCTTSLPGLKKLLLYDSF